MYSFVLGFRGKHTAPLKWFEYDGVFVYYSGHAFQRSKGFMSIVYTKAVMIGYCNFFCNGKVLIYNLKKGDFAAGKTFAFVFIPTFRQGKMNSLERSKPCCAQLKDLMEPKPIVELHTF